MERRIWRKKLFPVNKMRTDDSIRYFLLKYHHNITARKNKKDFTSTCQGLLFFFPITNKYSTLDDYTHKNLLLGISLKYLINESI